MTSFSVRVGDDVLEDLRRRLDATRWPDEPPEAGPEHGFGLEAARSLAAYWREAYDWRAAEAVLNSFDEQAVVDGVHYFADGSGPPLVLLHGWPSSVWEFVRLVPLLRAHARVIVPSLPGYTFSFAPGGARSSIV
ncbi:MAG TPA: epoxide hydrolase, partial [Solirubrobacter sp.]